MPKKSAKTILKELQTSKKAAEDLLNQTTKKRLPTSEERAAGKGRGLGGLIEVPVTEEDRDNYQRAIKLFDAEIAKVQKEVAKAK